MYLVNFCRIPLCLCRFSFLRPLHPSSPRNPEIVPVHKLLRHFVTNSAASRTASPQKTRPYEIANSSVQKKSHVYTSLHFRIYVRQYR